MVAIASRLGRLVGLALALVCGCDERGAPAPVPSGSEPVGAAVGTLAVTGSPSADASTTSRFHHERVELVDKAMGTRVLFAAYTTPLLDADRIRAAERAAYDEILRLEALMTTWREDSEVSAVNRAAGREAVSVGPETFAVIDKSLWISRASEGVFDITFASMGKLWRFDQDREARVPDAKLVAEARRRIDYRRIELDAAARTVRLTSPETRIDLGGIAKGYAIDRAAAVLRAAGLQSFFAQAGGDLYIAGRKPWGETWRAGVRDPRGPDGSFFAAIPIEDHAFSTAGDYERSFVLDGKRYHHIIDPRTGFPATASRSVTIWAKDALTADAIDDAVFILGPEKGLALVESIDDCGALLVDAQNHVWVSKRLEKLVQIAHQPTDGI